MTPRMWDVLVRKILLAQDRGDRLTAILITARLRAVIAEGGPR